MKNILLFISLISISLNTLLAQTIEVPKGSIIIDMGVIPQTTENGLKPYGLCYTLITEFNTPVIWSIASTKAKDGIDFTVDGRNFRGGTFIISSEFLTVNVLDEIELWNALGVVTYRTLSAVTVPLYRELRSIPNWVFDTNNGSIAADYLENAGIPIEIASREALPTELTTCDDLFILPHADPTWTEHGEALLNWNAPRGSGPSTANAGYIWSGCHAVSALENLYNPLKPSEQTNFLSVKTVEASDNGDDYFENALNLWGHDGASGIGPYLTNYPNHPYMQFIGNTDEAHAGGSEQIYLPVNNGGWRPTTKIGAWDPNQEDLGALSSSKAALIAFGPAFGDSNRGFVMYEGGHQLTNGSEEENVAAQRAFLNFSFEAAKLKVPSLVTNTSQPSIIEGGKSIQFDVTGASSDGSIISYEWSTTSAIASFNDASIATPEFTTTLVEESELCIVTVKVSDTCGRITFQSWSFTIVPQPTAPVANNDLFGAYNTQNISFNALDNDSDINLNIDPSTFTPTSPLHVSGGNFFNHGNGDITFIPNAGFSGKVSLDYKVCDDTPALDGGPFCDTATIVVHVGAGSCKSNQTVSSETSYAFAVDSENKWKNSDDALGISNSKYSKSDNSTNGFVIFDLGGEAYLGSQILIRVLSDKGDLINGVIDVSTTENGFPNQPQSVSTIIEGPFYDTMIFDVYETGLRFVKITGDIGFGVESIQFEKEICTIPTTPIVAPTVNFQTTEDTTPVITGTWGGNMMGDDTLSVTVDALVYTKNNGLIVTGSEWSLSVFNTELAFGTYDIVANVYRTSSGQTVSDYSNGELFVVPFAENSQSSVTSGNDGGLESNGSLAGLIAKRNFNRKQAGTILNKKALQKVYYRKDYSTAKGLNTQSLENFLPETGFHGTEVSYVSSPTDLTEITNAQQVFSIDYYQGENRVAAVFATETEGSIYDHSKIICDRLNNSSLEDASVFSINSHQVISSKLIRATREVEYTLSFSIKLDQGSNELFSFWNISQYPQGDFYNFQIWGSSYVQIFSIATDIIESLSAEAKLSSTANNNRIPSVFVKSGYYSNGQIHLNIVNKANSKSIIFEGNIASSEVSNRFNITKAVSLSGDRNEFISIEIGNLFDVGFSLKTDESMQQDALYLADGPWGVDYLNDYATVEVFDIENELIESTEELHVIERQPTISGQVKGNVNLFRHLLPGDQTLDITDFNSIQFNITNNQAIEIILMPENLTDWNNRLRYIIPINDSETIYSISLEDFVNASGINESISNIKTVVFSIIGDYTTYKSYRMAINSLAFKNKSSLAVPDVILTEGAALKNYPNPFKNKTTIKLPIAANHADIIVYDMLGRNVHIQHVQAKNNKVEYNAPNLSKGIYKYTLKDSNDNMYVGTFLIE